MQSIYFAQPMRKQDFYPNDYYNRSSGYGNGGGSKQPFSKIVLLVLVLACIAGFAYGTKNRKEPDYTETDASSKVQVEIINFFRSDDGTLATVQAELLNNSAMPVYSIRLTFTITDKTGSVIAEKEIAFSDILLNGDSLSHTEVMELPAETKNSTLTATVNAYCVHRT